MSVDEAARVLAQWGYLQVEPGRWVVGDEECTANHVAHDVVGTILQDAGTEPADRLRIGFGLLDLLGEWWVTVELGWFLAEVDDPAITTAFWDGYRRRLEDEKPPEEVLYSLWVEWFENPATAAEAFAQVLGNDVGRLTEARVGRRAARVLANSGPVSWGDKHDAYLAARQVPDLHPALVKGILQSYHDYFGKIDPQAALALLEGLTLQAAEEGTESEVQPADLAALTRVLQAGGVNHYLTPELWQELRGDG